MHCAAPPRCLALTPLALAVGAAFSLPAQADDELATVAPAVTVVGQTPLPGLELPLSRIAAPVQSVTARDVEQSGAPDVSAFMNRRLGSVHVNEVQGNPFQVDVNYRGYSASPLLGTPQGLSVYFDGVRINQPFGDVVSWDLIPRAAIASMNLMPGSNPLFGLNTLGGALAIQTKEGRSNPGSAAQLTGGTKGRRALELQHGGFDDRGLEWFFAGNLFHDDGWRTKSPSEVRQIFGKVGWQDARSDLDLSVSYADNRLTGNGLQEARLLAQDYGSVYTRPDITTNRALFVNLVGKHGLDDTTLLSGNVYYRKIDTATTNGDVNQAALVGNPYLPGESAASTPFPSSACIAEATSGGQPNERCTGLVNRTRSAQENLGLSGQASFSGDVVGRKNLFIAGAAYDQSSVRFGQSGQYGYINAGRGVTTVDAWADGSGNAGAGDPALDARVGLLGRTRSWSLFATDTLSITEHWHATASGRYNQVQVHNRDLLNPGGGADSLDGGHRFSRFNPAAGLTYAPSRVWTAYAGYSEGSRTPTAIELGCANPDNPCKLPNAMAGDPPLKQVVAKTWDLGLRGQAGALTRWNLGVFRAENHDDILFVADDQLGYGYFKNFGKTRRQGVEAGASTSIGPVGLALNYTFLDATYRSAETVGGAGNSTNSAGAGLEGSIDIRPGDRIPLIPRQILKASADWRLTPALSVGADLIAVAGSFARGNENNRHEADGVHYLGSGRAGGYAVTNFGARYQIDRGLELIGRIENLFDRRYATAAQLGPTAFSADGSFAARPFPAVGGEYPLVNSTFYAPGAPRSIWVALRYSL